MENKDLFIELYTLDVNEYKEKRSNGSVELDYLSWSDAWAEIKKRFSDATYEIKKFDNNLPYVYDENTGYMVFTTMTINGLTHEMWLPVMDGANKAMMKEAYTYKTKYGDKVCEKATMFDVNKTIMRCLVKNMAMFGLGLYIYKGTDLPEKIEKFTPMTEEQKKIIDSLDDAKKQVIINRYKTLDLTSEQASKVINDLKKKGLI